MANFVKTKLTIGIASLGVIALIFFLERRNKSALVYKRWGTPLAWSDFTGPVPWFSRYAAGISSTVLIEFDSSSQQYHAYAAQANAFSWTKEDKQTEYTLNHEAYHFKISELHARMMNDYIRSNPGKSKMQYELMLATFLGELSYMQDQYDEQSDHSVNVDIQRHWEFKIDSMLALHTPDSGWVTDVYSGARIFFSSPPEITSGIVDTGTAYRRMILILYGTRLILDAYQALPPVNDVSERTESIINSYTEDSLKISLSKRSVDDLPLLYVTGKDSLNNRIHDIWIDNGVYTYRVATGYSLDADTLGFYQIANSFINSFSITNTDSYWIKKIDSLEVSRVITSPNGKNKKGINLPSCLMFGKKEVYGFYRGPIHLDDGGLMIAFDITRHADSLRNHTIAILPDLPLAMAFKQTETIYYIPKNLIPKGSFELPFGYSLKADSVKECYTFYGQSVKIDSAGRN